MMFEVGGGGLTRDGGFLFHSAKTMVSVLPKELEYMVEKLGGHAAKDQKYSLRRHLFLLALRRRGRFTRRNVSDSATEIPYWWRKICPESGQKRWLLDGVVTLF